MSGIMSTMALEEELEAGEQPFQFAEPPIYMYEELPPVGNPGWVSNNDKFYSLSSDIVQECLKSLGRHFKAWNTRTHSQR